MKMAIQSTSLIICTLIIFSNVNATIVKLESNAIDRDFSIPQIELIYGEDDRTEIDLYNGQKIVDASQSVAMRVSKRRLIVDRNNENRILFPNVSLKKMNPQICESEKFTDQVSLGSCSGFLVNETTLVTAGHCMTSEKECADHKWVFGFKEGVTELTTGQVYSCKKIMHQKYVYNEKEISDYAVIQLDRKVTSYTPLKLRKFGWPHYKTPLVVVGHPMGLPMKATSGGVVSQMNDLERENKWQSLKLRTNYFTTNLDAYGGNSGSPVFNEKTGKVEGILIQGADDFFYNEEKECMESRKLSNSHLEAYEKVMRITKIPGI